MNMLPLSLLLVSLLALAFAGAWWLAFSESRRLRERADEMNDRLLDVTNQLAAAKERARNLEDARAAMSEQFQIVSQQAMQASNEALMKAAAEREKLALERVGHTLKPVAEQLTRFEAQVKAMEEARAKDTGGLKQQIHELMTASNATREVTQKLAGALRRGAGVQGRWGEEVLRNVLQAAGLSARFDFLEQFSLDTEEGRRRPDVVVRLPGDASAVFVIDAKVNLTHYLQAAETTDEAARDLLLQQHARAVQGHVRDLSVKAYWDQFRDQGSPDFVAMFVPGDGLLAAALDHAPDLMTEAMDKKVIIVTPTTLFALCKAVAYGWRVEDQMKNANHIADLGRELYARLAVMGGHVGALGKSLGSAVEKYNDFVASLESRVLSKAREFEVYQVDHQGKDLPEAKAIESQPRTANKLNSLQSTGEGAS